jgi:hypothetical protein
MYRLSFMNKVFLKSSCRRLDVALDRRMTLIRQRESSCNKAENAE